MNGALEILELSHIPGDANPGMYQIGLPAKRITFADQQRRAINLLAALLDERRVEPGDAIAIIGAGVAGVTAAAYGIQRGLEVHVFETNKDPFALQARSSRWLHPNVYDWPNSGWQVGEARLPCMNWTAGLAAQVVRNLREQWRELLQNPRLKWYPGTRITSFEREGDGWLLNESTNSCGSFGTVILAIGFGEEEDRDAIRSYRYWRDNDLHQRLRNGGRAFISGCGDGGLVDAITLLLQDFRQEHLLDLAGRAAAHEQLVQDLLRIERNAPLYRNGPELTRALTELDVPKEIDLLLEDQLIGHTTVELNGRLAGPMSRDACLINRFVVSRLIKLGALRYRQGVFDPGTIVAKDSRYSITIDGQQEEFDVVVVRHGPRRATRDFPAIDSSLDSARSFLHTYSSGVDRTRVRAWPVESSMKLGGAPTPPANQAHFAELLSEKLQGAAQALLIPLGGRPIVRRSHQEFRIDLFIEQYGRPQQILSFDFTRADVVLVSLDGRNPTRIYIDVSPFLDTRVTPGVVALLGREIATLLEIPA